jgi:phosphoribosylformimino-5-aminoimidazole carboxamide ribotide isomerase
MKATVYPAIDVRGGRVVRLRQGDYGQETRYDGDPVDLAQRYAKAGARWLHLVDLDAARDGGYRLAPLLDAIKRDTALQVQTGGGVRDISDVISLLASGADRVVVGSVAALDPPRVAAWIERFGRERIVVALDARSDADGIMRVPSHGWTAKAAPRFDELLTFYRDAGALHVLCTVIERDGTLDGPDVAFYADALVTAPDIALQASGGICDRRDIESVFAIGCSGAVLGKALLESRVTAQEALAW